ncbi:unnamed protein product [Protopolystoma xenopodis]|uniref:Uncharacterized protein n=1 Tax=Protopolystoma xenopodis TaxID=117903 RepID=A0A3S5B2U8_9PLAT|nr:unnamed protein product [Protopolystoma xenopodis]
MPHSLGSCVLLKSTVSVKMHRFPFAPPNSRAAVSSHPSSDSPHDSPIEAQPHSTDNFCPIKKVSLGLSDMPQIGNTWLRLVRLRQSQMHLFGDSPVGDKRQLSEVKFTSPDNYTKCSTEHTTSFEATPDALPDIIESSCTNTERTGINCSALNILRNVPMKSAFDALHRHFLQEHYALIEGLSTFLELINAWLGELPPLLLNEITMQESEFDEEEEDKPNPKIKDKEKEAITKVKGDNDGEETVDNYDKGENQSTLDNEHVTSSFEEERSGSAEFDFSLRLKPPRREEPSLPMSVPPASLTVRAGEKELTANCSAGAAINVLKTFAIDTDLTDTCNAAKEINHQSSRLRGEFAASPKDQFGRPKSANIISTY